MAQSFSGNYAYNIDPKGRITVPAVYRPALGDHFTLGLNHQMNALALYPKEEWEETNQRLDRIAVTDAKGMAYVRMIKAFSYPDQELDAQGRILLPQTLRDKVHMDKAITFAGVGRYLEVWDTERFQAQCTVTEENFDQLLEYVTDRYF